MNRIKKYSENIVELHALDKKRRALLSSFVEKVIGYQQKLGLSLSAQTTEKIKFRINNESFKLLIMGEFNAGKSTFINAILGREVLPSKAVPATAIINIIKYGDNEKARLHFKDRTKKPLDVSLKELQKYVLIKSREIEDAKSESMENPMSHAEIWYPLDLLKKYNLQITDSPGLNEDPIRDKLTLDQAEETDAVLFLMSASGFGPSTTEMEAINYLLESEHEDIFYIINKWDTLRRAKSKIEVKEKALHVLPKLTKRKEDIYFVSAEDALVGRTENDNELEEGSGFKELEANLHKFLTYEKGISKIRKKANEFRVQISKMQNEEIPMMVNLLKTPQDELKNICEIMQRDLGNLEIDKDGLLNYLNKQRSQTIELTEYKIKDFFLNIDDKIDGWAEEYEMEISFPFGPQNAKKAIQDLSEEFSSNLEEDFKGWQKDILSPFMEKRMRTIFEELQFRADDFENKLDKVRLTLNGSDFTRLDESENIDGPQNALERILAAAGGFIVGGVGLGAIGAFFGWKEMLKSMLPNVAAIIGAAIIGLPLIPVALVVALITGYKAKDKMAKKIKDNVANNIKKSIAESSGEQIKLITGQLDQKLGELTNLLSAGMTGQIKELEERVEQALNNHNQGEIHLKRELEKITKVKGELEIVKSDVQKFITEL